jgi:acyl-CoA reductase-like NAD-dependent aldehyde dehydrogenase
MRQYKLWIAGTWQSSADLQSVNSPFTGLEVAKMPQATPAQIEDILRTSASSIKPFRQLSRYARSRLLSSIATKISERRAEFVDRIVEEAGKPRTLAEVEVARAVMTFTIASEEVKRFGGEIVPVDIEPSGRAFSPARTQFVPRGPVLAITPFNFPLNLVAHKVAPALAVGAPVIVKPPPQAPGAAVLLAEIFEQAANEMSDAQEKIPLGSLQVVSGSNDVIEKLITDSRISILSFTGSDTVGWKLQTLTQKKKVALELGGNAAVIINDDADLQRAASRCAFGGFAYAGQVCISVQRILVHRDVSEKFQKLLLEETKKLRIGDPSDRETVVSPLIDDKASKRLQAWVQESVQDGAQILTGGTLQGRIMQPTVMSGVKPNHKLNTEEAFGPIVTLETFSDFGQAIETVNRSRFGLQAGVFTDSSNAIRLATEELDVGGVIINEVPTYRADNMPYGGMKESGLGREGVRYTMHDFCEIKTVVEWRGT